MTESSPRSVSTAPGRPHTITTTAFTKLLIGQVLCHYLRASPAWSSYEYLTYSKRNGDSRTRAWCRCIILQACPSTNRRRPHALTSRVSAAHRIVKVVTETLSHDCPAHCAQSPAPRAQSPIRRLRRKS